MNLSICNMRFLILFFTLSISYSSAQVVSLKRDSILSQKDSIHISIQNNSISKMFFVMKSKHRDASKISYSSETVLKEKEKIISFIRIHKFS